MLMYVYIFRVNVEEFHVPKAIPRMLAMSDALVRKRIKVYVAMGGLRCGEVRRAGEEIPEF